MVLDERKRKLAEKLDRLIEESKYSSRSGQTMRDSLEPNPNGYNVAQIIGISMGNDSMFSKRSEEHQ